MIEIDYKRADNLKDAVDNLYTIITLLRSPDGCPWDRVQTSENAAESLIDETYEYIDGVIKNDIASEREEIGDVMINVFMALYIHDEKNDFKPYEAINEVCEKLIRRHPHVFSDKATAGNAESVLTLWNNVKENIEGKKTTNETIFSHIPSHLPPLETSYEIQKKLKKVGFDFRDNEEILSKVEEELNEVKDAIKNGSKEELEMEIGDLLFSVVNLSRLLKIRPNVALHRCNEKIKNRFQRLFDLASEKNIPLDKDHFDEMNALWDEIKLEEAHK